MSAPLNGPAGAAGDARTASARSLLRRELALLAERWGAADRRAKAAATFADRAAAEAERRDAEGEFWGLGRDVADLGLLVIRHMLLHRAEELRGYLARALPELDELAEAVARLEARR